jgi:hypothetical protein
MNKWLAAVVLALLLTNCSSRRSNSTTIDFTNMDKVEGQRFADLTFPEVYSRSCQGDSCYVIKGASIVTYLTDVEYQVFNRWGLGAYYLKVESISVQEMSIRLSRELKELEAGVYTYGVRYKVNGKKDSRYGDLTVVP